MLVNPFFYAKMGAKAVWGPIPLTEEFLKTGLGWLMGASLIGTHGVFGLIEFLWDLFQPGRGQWLPGLVGFLSHLFFGFMTGWVYQLSGSLLLGVLITVLIHMGLNFSMHLAEKL